MTEIFLIPLEFLGGWIVDYDSLLLSSFFYGHHITTPMTIPVLDISQARELNWECALIFAGASIITRVLPNEEHRKKNNVSKETEGNTSG